jgi:hypothetical protein
MNPNAEQLQAFIDGIFDDEARKEKLARQQRIDALIPIVGEADAEIVVAMEDEIRGAGKREIAKAAGDFIREKLSGESMTRRVFAVSQIPKKVP